MMEEEETAHVETYWCDQLSTQLCRLCANSDYCMLPIFEGDGVEQEIEMKIHKYLPIEVSKKDAVAIHICYSCSSTLNAWHLLYQNALVADEKLKKMVSRTCKKQGGESESTSDTTEPRKQTKDEPETITDAKDIPSSGPRSKHTSYELNKSSIQKDTDRQLSQCVTEQMARSDLEGSLSDFQLFCGVQMDEESSEFLHASNDEDTKEEVNLTIEGEEITIIKPSSSKPKFINLIKQEITESLEKISEFQTNYDNDESVDGMNNFALVRNPVSNRLFLSKEAGECSSPESSAQASSGSSSDTDEGEIPVITLFPNSNDDITNQFNHVCQICGKGFKMNYLLLEHSQIHLDDKEREKFYCDVCSSVFKRKRNLIRHMAVHGEVEENKYKCEKCNKTFSKQIGLSTHLKVHCDERPFGCTSCDMTFKWRKNLINHYKTHEVGNNKRSYTRSKIFSVGSKDKLVNQEPGVKTRLECQVCGKSLASKQTLYLHMRFHNGKLFECSFCGQALSTKKNRDSHERAHTGEKPFSCDICGKCFGDKQLVTVHRRIHFNIRPFNCSYCGKKFRRQNHLTQHIRTHTGEKPYTCEICPRAFAQVGDLRKHKMTHFEKIFFCECGEKFQHKRALEQHKKTHADIEFMFLSVSDEASS